MDSLLRISEIFLFVNARLIFSHLSCIHHLVCDTSFGHICHVNTNMRPIITANNSGKTTLFKKACLYLLPFSGCGWPPYKLLLLSSERDCRHPTENSRDNAFRNATDSVAFQGNKNLFLRFQITVSGSWPFD